MDQITLKIFEVEVPASYAPRFLHRSVRLDITELKADAGSKAVAEIENAIDSNPTEYVLQESTTEFSWGASGSGQEIELAIMAAAVGGAATPIIDHLIGWAKRKWRRTDESITLEEAVRLVVRILKDDWRVPGALEVVAASTQAGHHMISIESSRLRSRYEATVRSDGRLVDVIRHERGNPGSR